MMRFNIPAVALAVLLMTGTLGAPALASDHLDFHRQQCNGGKAVLAVKVRGCSKVADSDRFGAAAKGIAYQGADAQRQGPGRRLQPRPRPAGPEGAGEGNRRSAPPQEGNSANGPAGRHTHEYVVQEGGADKAGPQDGEKTRHQEANQGEAQEGRMNRRPPGGQIGD